LYFNVFRLSGYFDNLRGKGVEKTQAAGVYAIAVFSKSAFDAGHSLSYHGATAGRHQDAGSHYAEQN